jgi:thiol-disulfide isomerase/thioredoxin
MAFTELTDANQADILHLAESPWRMICLCAAWCDVCKQYRPGFERLAEAHPEVQFLWIDIEDQADLIGDLDVENFPTLLIQHDETVVFYGPVLPDPHIAQRLLAAQRERPTGDLLNEAQSSAQRRQWQQECNLVGRLREN